MSGFLHVHVQLYLILGSVLKMFFLFLFESSAHSIMSSGFEVRALTVDRNRLKRMRTNEDEEIFTIQVSNTMLLV